MYFGYDFYKECIDRGIEHVRELGPDAGCISSSGRLQRQTVCVLFLGWMKCPFTCRAPKR